MPTKAINTLDRDSRMELKWERRNRDDATFVIGMHIRRMQLRFQNRLSRYPWLMPLPNWNKRITRKPIEVPIECRQFVRYEKLLDDIDVLNVWPFS